MAQALRLHTINAAKVIGLDHVAGSLQLEAADMVVLAKDPHTVPEAELKDIRVERTYVDGVLAYSGGEEA